MKLADATLDLPGPDPHARNANKGASDQAAGGAPFAGVLSGVGAQTADNGADAAVATIGTIAAAGQIGTASVSASIPQAPKPQISSPQLLSADRRNIGVTAKASDKNVDALVGRLFKNVLPGSSASEPTTKADAGRSLNDGRKRQTTDQIASPDLIALLLGDTAAKTKLGPASAAEAGSRADVKVADDVPRPTHAPQAATAAPPLLTDVSISTHIAPTEALKGAVAADVLANPDERATSGIAPTPSSNAQNATDTGSAPSGEDHEGGSTGYRAAAHEVDELGASVIRDLPVVGGVAGETLPRTSVSDLISKITTAVAEASARNVQSIVLAAGPGAAAQTLTLCVEQGDLGPISIRMHLAGRSLDLRLTTSDDETLALLSRNRESLATALGDRHYQLHSLVIQDGGATATPGGHHVDSGETGGGARADTPNAEGHASGGEKGNPEAGRPRIPKDQSDDARPPRGFRTGSLFV